MKNEELKWLDYFSEGVSDVHITVGEKPSVAIPLTRSKPVDLETLFLQYSSMGSTLPIKKLDEEAVVTKAHFFYQMSLLLTSEDQWEKFLSPHGVDFSVSRDKVRCRIWAIGKGKKKIATLRFIPTEI